MLYRTTTPHSSSSSSLQALEMIHQHSSVDEFFVDNLLDLSNGFDEDEIEQFDEHPNGFNGEKPCSVSPQKKMEAEIEKLDDEKPCSVSTQKKMQAEIEKLDDEKPCSVLTQKKMEAENEDLGYELSFRENGLDNLEWLSQFVEEDSCSGYSLMTGKLPENKNQSATEKKIHVQGKSCFLGPVQTKPRTKRGRIGSRVWSLTGSSTSSASSSTTTTTAESVVRLNKRRKTKAEKPVQPRRCSHCGVQRTPQWRTGPMGAKTLCNACGVQFKSVRLLPEYRPACSPTFSSERHSNSHRKVLEMRQKKEAGTGGLAPPVHSV